MSIPAGAKLGHYEIIASIGAGGMGEVYRARDPRIGREVAVKVLPRSLATDEDRLNRFTLEARAAGALSHPNLLTIFDLGTYDGMPFIVSELLEGSTLRERLPLTHRKALDYALQIAAGLAAAHERGIIHRDLKPENIFVTTDERVKLLDFGLAKLLPDSTNDSATVERLTSPGMILGTVAYMAPEQVRGQQIDTRSDIFSFGTVLFEMLTSSHPFHRGSQIDTMNAILNDEPSFPPGFTAPALERIVRHAVEKNPGHRFQSVKDLAFAVETLSSGGESGAMSAKPRAKRGEKRIEKKPVKFTTVTFRRGFVMSARFAPDGSVVYGAAWEDNPLELFASVPGDPQPRSLGIADADILGVSPTGELAVSLGRRFLAGWATTGTLARLPLSGGAPREVLEQMQDADWSADGKKLAIIRLAGSHSLIEFPIGQLIYTTPHWISHLRISPGGEHLAFLDHPLWGDDGGSVVVIDLHGQKRVEGSFARSAAGIAWTPKGDEVWTGAMHDGAGRDIVALAMNGKERTVLASPGRQVIHDIRSNGDVLLSAENGRREILAGRRGTDGERNLTWYDWSFLTDISADGSRIVLEEQGAAARGTAGGIYIRPVDGSPAVHLGDGHVRTISPDGRWVAAMCGTPEAIQLLPVGAGASRTTPVKGLEMMVWWNWFPDGKRLLLWANEPLQGRRMYELALDGDGTVRGFGPEGVKLPQAISPDGKFVATTGPDDRLMIYGVDGDESREVPGSRTGDQALLWGSDNAIYVYQFGRVSVAIERLDLTSGERTEWQELRPADPAGVMNIQPVVLSANLESYAYGYRRFLSELFVVSGLL
ncbi:MAG TPA: protein kinase [Thermoanaerobaculia bacterium]|nr:protein kinase [Thermoanaerobaculia bacterium]